MFKTVKKVKKIFKIQKTIDPYIVSRFNIKM